MCVSACVKTILCVISKGTYEVSYKYILHKKAYFSFSYTHFCLLRAGKDWLEVQPTTDKFIVVHLLTNFASLPLFPVPYLGPPQISWWGNDLGFSKPPCMCIIMYDETSLVIPPKVRTLHCDVIYRSSWRQCRRRQGESFWFVDA